MPPSSDATATASSGPSSLLSTDSASSSSGAGVHKYSVSAASASRMAGPQPGPPKSTTSSQPVDESALFQSLEPAECSKIEEEFEKLTTETDLEKILESELEEKQRSERANSLGSSPVKRKLPSPETSSAASSIPFADEDTISALIPEPANRESAEEAVNVEVTKRPSDLATSPTSGDDLPDLKAKDVQDATAKIQSVFRGFQARKAAKQEEVLSPDSNKDTSGSYNSVKIKPSLDSSSEVDEFQDEIHFDPTISSGHLGYSGEGGFRNTPIKLDNKPQSATPIYENSRDVEKMTRSEAEQGRHSVLS